MRETLKGNTRNVQGHINPILHSSVDGYVTHLVHAITVQYDAEIAGKIRSKELKTVLAGISREDVINRGPSDGWCLVPLGCEFVVKLLADIDSHFSRLYQLNSDTHLAHRCAVLSEYMFGLRVFEAIPKSTNNHTQPSGAPSDADHDRSALIHTLEVRMLSFKWPDNPKTYFAHKPTDFPAGPPLSATIMPSSSKNWAAGSEPSTIYRNSMDQPFNQTFDAVSELWKYVCQSKRAPTDFLFSGVKDKTLRVLLKTTARNNKIDERRAHLRCLRIGCCSATTPDIFDYSVAMVAAVRQQHQHWRPGNEQPYVHAQLSGSKLKSLQLYDIRLTNIADVIARFMRFSDRSALIRA